MKRASKIIAQIAVLYGFYLLGKAIQQLLHLPVPGSIIAMLLLFLLLVMNVVKEEWLFEGGQFLLSHLTLLFIPATVGIMDYFSLFKGRGMLSVAIVIVSTGIVMVSAGAIGQWSALRREKREYLSRQAAERMEA